MLASALVLLLAPAGHAEIHPVGPGESIQAAIDAAADGDVVSVAAGTFTENIDFAGKAITVVGAGPASVIHGLGTGPVVTFASGETSDSVLDSFTITGGVAENGGGILIAGTSPTIVRNVITGNAARNRGSGLLVDNSGAAILNNLISYNHTAYGDPHSIDVSGGTPAIINNTIVFGDSNAIILRGPTNAIIMNNAIALNGAIILSAVRGRGICDFSTASPLIMYNLFYRNLPGAILSNTFTDYRRIARAQRILDPARVAFNVDGTPRTFRDHRRGDFTLGDRSRARDAGNPDALFYDLDGSRNDVGFTGGPLAR
jgi:hypothetical protein